MYSTIETIETIQVHRLNDISKGDSGGLRLDGAVGAADGTGGAQFEPGVQAERVVAVQAGRHHPHHLPHLELLHTDRTLLAPVEPFVVPAPPHRRQPGDLHLRHALPGRREERTLPVVIPLRILRIRLTKIAKFHFQGGTGLVRPLLLVTQRTVRPTSAPH